MGPLPGITDEQMATFATVCHVIATMRDEPCEMTLYRINDDTGETLETHVHIHSALVCELMALEHLDAQIGDDNIGPEPE